jgi:micrococcal nuclease
MWYARHMRIPIFIAALLIFLNAFPAFADCYDWPLREGSNGRVAYDADTIYVLMPEIAPELEKMSVRVNGVDAPEIRGECDFEKDLAKKARDYVLDALEKAENISFCNPLWGKYAGRVVADVMVGDKLLSEMIISNGLGRSYDGGKRKNWCD